MKKSIKISLVIILILIVTLTTALFAQQNKSSFDKTQAISMVIKDHPDFPSNPSDVISKKLPTGGKMGSTADVKFTTEVNKTEESSYMVILSKDWGLSVNGKYVKSIWKYEVTANSVKLVESLDNDMLPELMK